ncbi:PREDICTED: PRUPE_7G017400 partial [Prunus dulcis]|uniref:PREDICTED: PRUPE_7G017400 partial n=1 Tax=Prunus dulcis TaxID=3755 RepID=A0A5E4FLZ4_PRUDU|nr:PREDICTED: PRUPE_7G017400 partial [Prunus dulcis]
MGLDRFAIFKSVVSSFSNEKMTTIDEMGFGPVCRLACPWLFRSLCLFVVANFNVYNNSITVHQKTVKIDRSDLEKIISCKDRGCDVEASGWCKRADKSATSEVYVGKDGKV